MIAESIQFSSNKKNADSKLVAQLYSNSSRAQFFFKEQIREIEPSY